MESAARRPSLLEVSRFWLWAGSVSWGGMYTILPRVKAELAEKGWLTAGEFDAMMAVATLVPGPTFVALAGLIGHRIRGALGSLIAMVALMVPPAAVVAAAMMLLSERLTSGPLAPVIRMVTIAMAGVILGNAWRLAREAPFRWIGLLLAVGTAVAMFFGLPVVWIVVAAVVAGRFLLGGERA